MTTRIATRSCPICEASCGLRLEVDDEAQRVLRIEGDAQDPRSRGHVCPKAYALSGVHEDPDRLRRPLRRTQAGWEELAWDDAFDLAAERILALRKQHGPGALGVYVGNPTGFDAGAMLYTTFFLYALQTPRVFTGATMDHFPKLVSSRTMYGRANVLPIPDIDRCDYFLCLGGNPVVSQGSLMAAPDVRRRLRAIRDRGGKLVVVDPRRTETAREADRHLFIRPGSDALFLFAIVRTLFDEGRVDLGRLATFTDGVSEVEELASPFTPEAVAQATGIAAAETRRIARELAETPRAVCYGRIGTCTVAFGTLASWLIDVVNILTGHFDAEGGMMFPRPATGQLEGGGETGPFAIGRWHSSARGLPEIDGQLPSAAIAEEIDAAGDARMRAFVTVAGNPVLSTPNGTRLDRALPSLDFMLSVDIYRNETTRHADLILPTASQLEHDNFDLLAQGTSISNFTRYSPRVLEPEPDTRAHWEVLLELAARLNDTSAEALEAQVFAAQARRAVARKDSPAFGTSAEDAMAAAGDTPGPLRLIDLMLRAGPYGDGFDDDASGLSLAKVKAVPHAIDLGPLTPRLPDILRNPGRRIALAPAYVTADVARLRDSLTASATEDELLLIGRRQARNMNSWLHNVGTLAKGKPRCTLLVHPTDATRHGLVDGGLARVRSRAGALEVPVEVSDEVMPGVVSLPHGFGHAEPEVQLGVAAARQPGVNANVLTDETPLDPLSGTGIANGIPVELAPAV